MARRRAQRRLVATVRLVRAMTVMLVGCGSFVVLAPDAGAAVGPQRSLSITYVARQCGAYTDVMANKARNNLQESLRDLGPDSTYGPGAAITVAEEDAGSPACAPLPGWGFSTGTGITGKTPATLQLSTVVGTLRSGIVTETSVPELDSAGQPTGRQVAGAVTVNLDAAEAAAAARNALWVQGGTPAQPLNGLQEQYGFAALRCARDAVNGDNVESVSFPSGARHVFCYYYAVTPPPTAGTITIRKEIADGSSGSGTFAFAGDVSYADSDGDGVGDFTITASDRAAGQASFVRAAGGEPWTFQEQNAPGWDPGGPPDCTATNPEGPTTSTFDVGSDQSVAVTLGPLDDVVCTFTNGRSVAGAVLRKETLGGTGDFTFELVGATAPPVVALATTIQEGVPVTAIDLADLPAETYTATEILPPPTPAGTWELEQASCNGQPLTITQNGPLRRQAQVTASGGPLDCVATNRFTPGGSITVTKTTLGAAGTFDFLVAPVGDATTTYPGTATTLTPGEPAFATEDGAGTGALIDGLVVEPAATYTVTELLPAPSDTGQWQLVSASCGPGTGPLIRETATVQVTLSLTEPDPTCAFVNQFVPWGTLDLAKSTTSDSGLRPGEAALVLTCGDQLFPLTVPAGMAQGTLPQQLITGASTCTVDETATGAATGVQVDTSAQLTVNGATQPFQLGQVFAVGPGQAIAVSVTNAFVDPSPPPQPQVPEPAPPPVAAPEPGRRVSSGVLADTGAGGAPALSALAGALVASGAALALANHALRHTRNRR